MVLAGNGQEKVLGRNVLILKFVSFVESAFQNVIERPPMFCCAKPCTLGKRAISRSMS